MSSNSRLKNAFPSLILQSPLNGIMSDKYAIIEFTGRKTGTVYRTPIAYVREGDTLLMSTDSRWWRNLQGGAPVSVILRGKKVSGKGWAIENTVRGAEILRTLVDAIPTYAKPADLSKVNGRVSDEEIHRAVTEAGRVSIEVHLEVPA